MKKVINRYAFELINGIYMVLTIVMPLVLNEHNLIPVQLIPVAYIVVMTGIV